MSRRRLIPERTVDSLLAAEWIRNDPNALIWSPTNHSGSPDHLLYAPGLHGFVIECKAVVEQKVGWSVELDGTQLDRYAQLSEHVYYVFLTQPDDPDSPWKRSNPGGDGPCLDCPRDGRALAELTSFVAGSPHELRLQAWFAHWALVMTAKRLGRRFGGSDRVLPTEFLTHDSESMRLCQFLSRHRRGEIVAPQLRNYGLDNYPDLWSRSSEQQTDATGPVLAITGIQGSD